MTVSPSSNGQAEKGSRILIIGATGFIGQFIAQASLASSQSTYIITREAASSPSKVGTIKALEDQGAILVHVNHLYIFSASKHDWFLNFFRSVKQ